MESFIKTHLSVEHTLYILLESNNNNFMVVLFWKIVTIKTRSKMPREIALSIFKSCFAECVMVSVTLFGLSQQAAISLHAIKYIKLEQLYATLLMINYQIVENVLFVTKYKENVVRGLHTCKCGITSTLLNTGRRRTWHFGCVSKYEIA